MSLFLEQTLNGLQAGFTLLMISSGLTLIFGMMGVLHLAHGSVFMVGAFVGADVLARTGSFLLALGAGVTGAAITGVVMETAVVRRLYHRDHLDQVLATFGLVLMANQGVQMIWGSQPRTISQPSWLGGSLPVLPGVQYPVYRLAIIGAGILTILVLWLLIERTRYGAVIRAGIEKTEMVSALGIDIERLFTLAFAFGAALAGLAGALAAPQILGGPSSFWFTQIIYRWFNTGGNWPQGAAYAIVLLLACLVFVLTVMRVFKVSLGEIAK